MSQANYTLSNMFIRNPTVAPLTSYPGWSPQLFDKATVESWRIGKQLRYALLTEAQHPCHPDGIPVFLQLMHNLPKLIKDEDSITVDDTRSIFDMIVKENRPQLLDKVLNNACLVCSRYNEPIAQTALKQAIRVGSLDVLKLMMDKNVPILSQDMNTFDDIKSIIFNILRSVEIGSDERPQTQRMTNTLWNYIAKSFHARYTQNAPAEDKKLIEIYARDDGDDNDDKRMVMTHNKFFIRHALIEYAVIKKVHASSSGKHYINKLLPVLQFVCEHFMTFDDERSLTDLHTQCLNDKQFDCSAMVASNIDGGKMQRFWSEYLTMKLIDDFMGFDQASVFMRRKKHKRDAERQRLLSAVKYLVANGVACHLDDVIMPQLRVDPYVHHPEIKTVLNAIEYGRNVW
eukprot:CAMPEP_0202713860 /NCGR_PEP_ID=MMETSP1385-20130828/60668_1 /ASSEMBLY_ACC=CAM_ASM_000861 /TAXON_ID=933848 /ORGANISM="Elphidium margaritaceum" /LENGTH=400 /DNA_ID=CAMNT_0049374393 /DNA_START=31 /DNA_END=1230 /DNA_ORIENTATION=-